MGEAPVGQDLANLGLTGLGTSAARLATRFAAGLAEAAATTAGATTGATATPTPTPIPTPTAAPTPLPIPDTTPTASPGYVEREWGDGTASPVYVPVVERIDDALADEVDDRLVRWGEECGFRGDELDQLRKAGFGRLAMLTHTDTADPEQLLLAAKLNAAWWAADDLYADNTDMGATPAELPPRLALAMAAMDPVAPAGEFDEPLEEAVRSEPVLIALRSAVEHLERAGTPAQVQRICYSTFAMFVSWNTYAAWRYTGEYPPAWKYLATRQHDTFATSMTLIDPVGGYEVPANLYYDPRVRRALTQAGTASVLINDLLSVAKDAADENPVCNMVLQIAADRNCSVEEATEATVALHNKFVHDFEELHESLSVVPSPELQRFLRGLRAWMGGGFEWHNTNPRYRTAP
ncbi:family 2 encapsulin nanocompartment cargo protein terpene cyclase [Saccharothrix syringae]|uniref:family 2 encapsulin nanocompartment cargo protein terpene cyclase n=1 Tax=Saccharothrix syringae TaxID=103733 RepID=UPI00224102EE|nr:family 2 encapsulin nanocompartment cargo protein terpene cyclase [Saccharothrix syringae]